MHPFLLSVGMDSTYTLRVYGCQGVFSLFLMKIPGIEKITFLIKLLDFHCGIIYIIGIRNE